MICGICWLTFLYPPLGSGVFMFTAPFGLLNSVLMIVWLFVFGVNEEKWKHLRMESVPGAVATG